MSLYRLIYISATSEGSTEQELDDIITASRRNNKRLNITGCLFASQQRYLQILEGQETLLKTLYRVIVSDPRHREVELISFEPVEARLFANWSMGLTRIDQHQFDLTLTTLNDVVDGQSVAGDAAIEQLPQEIGVLLQTHISRLRNTSDIELDVCSSRLSNRSLVLFSESDDLHRLLSQHLHENIIHNFGKNVDLVLPNHNGPSSPIDLVLIDIDSLGQAAFDLCLRIRQQFEFAALPVIFVTSNKNTFTEEYCFDIGSNDVIDPSISSYILRARCAHQLCLLDTHRTLQQKNLLLEHESEEVEYIINYVRRTQTPPETYNFQYFMTPVSNTSGDIVLSGETPQGTQLYLLGDFTGHGITAAIASGIVATEFSNLVSQGIAGGKMLRKLDELLCSSLPTGRFMTALLLQIEADKNKLKLWNASMPPAQVRTPQETNPVAVDATFYALGIQQGQVFEMPSAEFDLRKEMAVLMFSDGLLDASRELWDFDAIEKVEQWFQEQPITTLTLSEIMSQVIESTRKTMQDDVSALLFRY